MAYKLYLKKAVKKKTKQQQPKEVQLPSIPSLTMGIEPLPCAHQEPSLRRQLQQSLTMEIQKQPTARNVNEEMNMASPVEYR